MAQFGEFIGLNILAKEDLTANQYFVITCQDGKIANTGAEASGILMNKPGINEGASAGMIGELPFQAGAAINANAKITVETSGYCEAAGSGDHIVGRNGQSAVTSGSIGRGQFNFNTPVYAFSSSYVA
jgi:hypothetical protein